MPEKIIIEDCSPTLAGIKTGNIFTLDIKDVSDIYEETRALNKIFTLKGLRAIPLKITSKNLIMYLSRPEKLKCDLSCKEARAILKKKGYTCSSIEEDICKLIKNLKSNTNFPHEIGLFLGYPPCDVNGFMEDTRKGVKCTGYWKVYGDKEKAEKIFCRYKKCTEAYIKSFTKGRDLAQMVVNTKAHSA